MKTCEEMARDVLAARDEYDKKKKARKKAFAVIAPAFALAVAIGTGVAIAINKNDVPIQTADCYDTSVIDETDVLVYDKPSAETEPPVSKDKMPDAIGWIEIDGTTYVQSGVIVSEEGEGGRETFMLGEYLGKAEELEGSYKSLYDRDGISGDAYRVNWEDANIVIFLTNGGIITLMAEK